MAVTISQYDPTLTIEKLQTQVEGQYYDRKSARIALRDLATHICGMANGSGGIVAVGIEDSGEITGITDKQENGLRQLNIDYMRTPPKYEVETVPAQGRNIFLYHIAPSTDEVIKLKNGDAYLRVGDSTRKLNAEQLLELEYAKGIRSYESKTIPETTLEDLDDVLIGEYCTRLGPSIGTPLDILKSRGLIRKSGDDWEITVAAVLLFGKIPTQFLPSARVRFVRYGGITAGVGETFNVEKDITIERPLHYLITEGQMLLRSQMREFQRLGRDGKFQRIPEYPEFAWLEGLVNAVTHRDYSIMGDYTRILMFDDHIEFVSPGRLPGIVTVENIQNTRFSRNPMIARVLSDFGWVRELNEGVKRIYRDMDSYFLDPPEFSEPNNNTLKLVLKNNIGTRSVRRMESLRSISPEEILKLGPLDRNIIYFVANINHCTMKKLIEVTGRTRETLIQHIRPLLTQNGGPIEEHRSSPRDPTKYYTIN